MKAMTGNRFANDIKLIYVISNENIHLTTGNKWQQSYMITIKCDELRKITGISKCKKFTQILINIIE